jgi:hypothetical protein
LKLTKANTAVVSSVGSRVNAIASTHVFWDGGGQKEDMPAVCITLRVGSPGLVEGASLVMHAVVSQVV